MTKRGVITLAFGAMLLALAAVSCKDDDEDEYLYLNGTLKFKLDSFLAPGSVVTMEPSGVTHPEGGEIYYVWTVSSDILDDSYVDTTDVFTFDFGTELTMYTVSCSARADDYVSTSTTLYTNVVKGGLDGTGSLTDSLGNAILNLATLAVITDTREETPKTYYYTGLGGYDWFIQNLEYMGPDGTIGMNYDGCEAANDLFGVYYSYDEAMSACPDGWKLPTADEWDECVGSASGTLMANMYINGTKMWEFWPAVKISNKSYFTAIPTGEANLVSGTFTGFWDRAVFWTATESETDPDKAVVKYFMDDQPEVFGAYVDKESFGASVRCVRKGKFVIPY